MDRSHLGGKPDAMEMGVERLNKFQPSTITMLLNHMEIGGAERVVLDVLHEMLKSGQTVDLVLLEGRGKFLQEIPEGVRLIRFDAPPWSSIISNTLSRDIVGGYIKEAMFLTWQLHHMPNRLLMRRSLLFARYLEANRPSYIMPHTLDTAAVTMLALRLTSLNPRPPVVPVIHVDLATMGRRSRRKRLCKPLQYANALIAVSQGQATSIAKHVKISPSRIEVVHNGVQMDDITNKSAELPSHPWFLEPDVPVVLGVGRLLNKKGFPTLMRAFHLLRERMDCRLMIVGDGPKRAELLTLASEICLGDDFQLLAETLNPYAYMRRASVLAFPSSSEAFGMVPIEALACGCPIVSTNCSYGPGEILANGRYGVLVPVGDHEAMACALERIIRNPPSKELLQRRAEEFSVERCVSGYLRVLASVTQVDSAEQEQG